MSKYTFVSLIFVVLGLLVIVGSAYYIYTSAGVVLTGVAKFVTSAEVSKLQACGINPPEEFKSAQSDLPALLTLFPVGVIGVPFLISFLMFIGGYYYHRAREEDERNKNAAVEKEVVHKIVKKMETEKSIEQPPMDNTMETETMEKRTTKKRK